MLSKLLLFSLWTNKIDYGREKIFYLVFIEMQMFINFFGSAFLCNNINTNLNKNFYT